MMQRTAALKRRYNHLAWVLSMMNVPKGCAVLCSPSLMLAHLNHRVVPRMCAPPRCITRQPRVGPRFAVVLYASS